MYKKIVVTAFVFSAVLGSYFLGQYQGVKKGVDVAAVFAISGRSAEQANMLALMLSMSRRGDQEKMYEWGEKFLVQNIETHNMIQNELKEKSAFLKGSDPYKTLDAMVDTILMPSTDYYMKNYIDKNGGGDTGSGIARN